MIKRIRHIAVSMRRKMILIFTLCLLSVQSIGDGNEYNLKAMFVLNFIKYIEWPGQNQNEFRIAIAGKSDIKDALLSLIKMKTASSGRKIKVFNLEDNSGFVPCEILFIPNGESLDISAIQKMYAAKGVLIVSEDNKNASKGACINLINIDNKIRFEIFQSQAKLAGIKISSRLTELASNVYP